MLDIFCPFACSRKCQRPAHAHLQSAGILRCAASCWVEYASCAQARGYERGRVRHHRCLVSARLCYVGDDQAPAGRLRQIAEPPDPEPVSEASLESMRRQEIAQDKERPSHMPEEHWQTKSEDHPSHTTLCKKGSLKQPAALLCSAVH